MARFLGAFCLLYFGTKAVIGLTVPGGYYSEWVADNFNYPSLLRYSLLHGTRLMAGVFGYDTYLRDAYHITMVNGRGIHLAYDCYGYGLLSFWIAFIFANQGSFRKKTFWILAGCITIWGLNVCRLTLVLIASNKKMQLPYNWSHHTFYNIITYAFIFVMIWLFSRSEKRAASKENLIQ